MFLEPVLLPNCLSLEYVHMVYNFIRWDKFRFSVPERFILSHFAIFHEIPRNPVMIYWYTE